MPFPLPGMLYLLTFFKSLLKGPLLSEAFTGRLS